MDNNKKKEELKSLYKSLYELSDKFDKAKGKRAHITILVFALFNFAFFYFVFVYLLNSNLDIYSVIVIAIISIVLALIHFWVNLTIFGQLLIMGREENETLERIRERIREIEKTLY